MKTRNRKPADGLLPLLAALSLPLHAATVTWDASGDPTWSGPSDVTSWAGATYSNGDDAQFLGAGSGTVTTSGAVNPNSVTVDSGNDYTFTGSGIGGASTITKNGTGTLFLLNANTYTGDTTINGGEIRISHNDALGTTGGGTFLGANTKLELAAGLTIAEPITNQGNGNGKLTSISGTHTLTGLISLESNMDIRGSNFVFQGGFTSAANEGLSFNGTNYIVETTPILINGGTFGLTSASNDPANTSQLNVAGNDWGLMRINFGGYLTLGAANIIPADAGVEFGWHLDSSSSGSLDLNGFDQTIAFLRQSAAYPANNGDQNVTGGGTLTINTPAGSYDYHGRITDGAIPTSIVKTGVGTQILNNQSGTPSSYSGSLTIDQGVVESRSGSDFSDPSKIILSGGTLNLDYAGTDLIGALDLGSGYVANGVYNSANSGGLITGSGSLTVDSSLISPTWNGTTDLVWSNPDSTSWSSDYYVDGQNVFFEDSGAGTVTISGTVAPGSITVNSANGYTFSGGVIGGSASIVKSGTGYLILNGNNTYSGTNSINEGRADFGGINSGAGATTVADNASIGGEGTIGGALTFGSSAGANLHIDGSTSSALTIDGPLNTSAGVTVFVENGGPGLVTVLNYDNGESNTIDLGDFILSAGGVGTFSDTGSSITVNIISLGTDKNWVGGDATNPGFWDVETTANWSLGAGAITYGNGDKVIFADSAASYSPILQSNVSPGAVFFSNFVSDYTLDAAAGESLTIDSGLTVDGLADVVINAAITGSGLLTKGDNNDGISDAGVLTLTSPNTWTGGTNLTEGGLSVTDSNALGTGSVSITDDGQNSNKEPVLDLDANNLNIPNDIVITNVGWNKRIRFDISGSGSNAELSGNINLLETLDRLTSVTAGSGDTLTITGKVSGGGVLNVRDGSGVVSLVNDTNDFTGLILVQDDGVVEITTLEDSGVPCSAGAGSYLSLGYASSSGTVRYTGTGATTNRQIRIGEHFNGSDRTGGGTLDSSGTGPLVFANAAFNEPEVGTYVGPRMLTLTGPSSGNNEILGVIADNNDTTNDQPVTVEKDGSGIWTLWGNNSYTGDTIVRGTGTLFINGNHSSATGLLTVTKGATLAGVGTLGGLSNIDGVVSPGNSIGVFTLKDTILDGTLAIEVDGGTSDLLVVDGNLDLNSTSDLAISEFGAGATQAAYIIASYTSLTGSFGTLNVPAGYLVDYNYQSLNQIALVGGNAVTDSDGDEIPDSWEITHFGDLTTATATSDYDGDGRRDFDEYVYGTDPKDAADRFTVTIAYHSDDEIDITYGPVRVGRTYTVTATSDIQIYSDLDGAAFTAGANAPSNTFTDTTNINAEFYSVRIELNP
ncbi:beta strand repeat-containing protein [Haloferula sp.]|uniref:beta strand repeat-containing protein n=1 Tax=Haloferula sp. TaxID=2497595 RepID=UPI00329B5977